MKPGITVSALLLLVLAVACLLCPPLDARAEQIEFINVSQLGSRTADTGGSAQALISEMPIDRIEEPDSWSQHPKIFYYRNQTPFVVRAGEEIIIRLRMGDIQTCYYWTNSGPDSVEWFTRVYMDYGGGRKVEIERDGLEDNERGFLWVQPHGILEIHVLLRGDLVTLPRRLWLTVSPINFIGEEDRQIDADPATVVTH